MFRYNFLFYFAVLLFCCVARLPQANYMTHSENGAELGGGGGGGGAAEWGFTKNTA